MSLCVCVCVCVAVCSCRGLMSCSASTAQAMMRPNALIDSCLSSLGGDASQTVCYLPDHPVSGSFLCSLCCINAFYVCAHVHILLQSSFFLLLHSF